MKEIRVQIANRLGLHARAAARFVHLASRFTSKITVTKDNAHVDGKSILGLLTLAARTGCSLKLRIDGEDEEQASSELGALVRSGFGEEAG